MSNAGNDSNGGDAHGEPDADGFSERLDRLVGAVESLVREVEGLGARLDRLESTSSRRGLKGAARGRRRSAPSESVEVVMRPVTELAMAAVAERALRKAEAVESVTRAEGGASDDRSARYRVEVRPGIDLVGEVGKTLPVSFSADETEPGVFLFDLDW